MERLQREQVVEAFREVLGGLPEGVVFAPGRVNLIGEHTDYNEGFVLPLALDWGVWLAFRRRRDDRVVVHALDMGEVATWRLGDAGKPTGWVAYVRGVLEELAAEGLAPGGWEGVLRGDLPIGAGLSSSAAVELAVARVAYALTGSAWEPERAARVAQRAEHRWAGVACGIMDQMTVACARAGHALLLDCRTLAREWVPVPEGALVAVLDTGTRRGLTGSAYNERRAQCEEAARRIGVPALRDVTPEAWAAWEARLPEPLRRRARHVVHENARTLAAAEALRRGDLATVGRLMDESHESLRVDFEVSSAALDAMVSCAREAPGCYGARMTGAGFAGCAVALVAAEQGAAFAAQVSAAYAQRTGREGRVLLTRPADGVRLV